MVRITLIVLSLALMLVGYTALGSKQIAPQAGLVAVGNVDAKDVPVGGVRGAGVAAVPEEPKTQLIGSLIRLLKTVDVDNQQDKTQVESSLRGADDKLSGVLGENSKRLIMEANRRPPYISWELRPSGTLTGARPPSIESRSAGPANPHLAPSQTP